MNSNYILPVAVAAAIHAVALFGFTKSPRDVVPKENREILICGGPLLVPDVVELPEPSGETSAEKKTIEPPPVTQPEPFTPVIDSGFTITPPPIDPAATRDDSTIIPTKFVSDIGPGNGPGVGPILSTLLDNSPRTRLQAAPNYPHSAKMAGLTGEVLVEFTVDESGRVIEPHVVRSTDQMFEESTLRAVAKWQFEPGRRAGRIVRFRMAVPVVFNLNE